MRKRTLYTPSPFKDRPSWWNPDKVTSLIASGEHPVFVCRRAREEMGDKISISALQKDLGRWRASATHGDALIAAMSLHAPLRSSPSISKYALSKRWYGKFYAAMERPDVAGNIPLACDFTGIGVEIVYALIDKRNTIYDKEFAERVRILEGIRISGIRENYLEAAKTNAKIGGEVLMAAMPALHSPIQKVEVEGEIHHDHRISPEVLAAAQARSNALLAHRTRPPALPADASSDVIDVGSAEVVPISRRRDRDSG